jgi:hypothetical protein
MMCFQFMLFSSCKGLRATDCKKIINRAHRIAPYKFGNVARVHYKMERVRDPVDKTDPAFHPDSLLLIQDYWLIGIRTDFEGNFVAGIDDAGKVEYNYPWCTADETELGYTCYDLGPWDCSGGLTWTECCDYAKAQVTDRGIALTDLHGNVLECYDSPPPISEADPVDYGRVKLRIDKGNIVVQAPKNG